MSSIRHQEPLRPTSKSPIPRSRSDFNYAVLTPKEKRWTTDFSLLLPPFPRDTTGYSRLAESPVTHQPKPLHQQETQLNHRPDTSTSKTVEAGHIPTIHSTARNHASRHANEDKSPRTMARSQTLGPLSSNDCIEPRELGRSHTAETVTSLTINFNEAKRTKSGVRRSPTSEPYNDPKCNSKLYPTIELSPISGSLAISRTKTNPLSAEANLDKGPHLMNTTSTSDKHRPCRHFNTQQMPELTRQSDAQTTHLSTHQPTLEATRHLSAHSPALDATRHLSSHSPALEATRQPAIDATRHLGTHKPTFEATRHLNAHSSSFEATRHLNAHQQALDANRHLSSHTPALEAARHLMTTRHLTPEAGRHLMAIRKSPTMDSRTLRYSPLLSQHIISRSPTLDPSVLNRSPRCCQHTAASKSALPNNNRGTSSSEVVRSQSLRSLRRAMDRSPAKIRNSDSAQSDVTCPIHRAFPLVEADEFDEDDFRRLRNFSVTNKGVINWGDSFRSQSLTSVPNPPSCTSSQWDVASTKSYPMTSSNSHFTCSNRTPQRYRVVIMGADEVGKTSLIRQFQTSEYICAFDTSYDVNKDYAISVILNKEESELEFIEHRLSDESDENDSKCSDASASALPYADAHVVVYSVTNRRSFQRAVDLLAVVQKTFRRSAVLLVGNKSDLVRVRAVTTDDGQTSAKDHNCPFIETSAAINHQVDELLVSILTHIRTTTKVASSSSASRWRHSASLYRAKGLIKKFLKKACFQSKSSDNLQRL